VFDEETTLAKQLRKAAERHAADHDVCHLGHAQARACAQRIEELIPHAERYGLTPPTPPASTAPAVVKQVRHTTADLLAEPSPPAGCSWPTCASCTSPRSRPSSPG